MNKNDLRDKLIRFMYGRYGADELYKFSAAVIFVLLILNIFLRSIVLSLIITILIALSYYRVLSRRLEERRKENRIYLKHRDKIKGFFRIQKLKLRDRKTHCYKKCPSCKKMLRLPKKKGNHTVCCPQCKNNFNVKI